MLSLFPQSSFPGLTGSDVLEVALFCFSALSIFLHSSVPILLKSFLLTLFSFSASFLFFHFPLILQHLVYLPRGDGGHVVIPFPTYGTIAPLDLVSIPAF
jgi:hypothetical protein